MDYKKMAAEVLPLVGGKENVSKATHCVTRLRLILNVNTRFDKEAIENLDGVKGVFFNSGQLQIIYGPKVVEAVYEEFLVLTGLGASSVADVKKEGTEDLKPLQKAFKIFSDIFVPIIPAFVGAAMIVGVKSLLTTAGLFGLTGSLADQSRLIADFASCLNIIAATFTFLPVLITYSAVKRFGGNPILGIVLGCIMIHPDLMSANAVAAGSIPEYWNLLGFPIPIVGFQGGVFSAILASWFMAKTEKVLQKHVPQVISFIVVPSVTLLLSGLALFLVFGPLGNVIGRGLGIATDFLYNQCGVVGAFAFAALLQPLVITGTHHAIQGIEASLVANTGFNYIQPLWSVSIIAQGGACLGMYLLSKRKSKNREVAMSSFIPTLFGVSEPAIFAVNIKDSIVPFICAITGAGIGGAIMKLLDVKAIGFALTGLPGLTIVYPPAMAGYVIGNLVALILPIVLIVICSKMGKLKTK